MANQQTYKMRGPSHRRRLRDVWEVHIRLMQTDTRYARVLIQGIARAFWQRSWERCVYMLVVAAIEIYALLHRSGEQEFGFNEAH